MAQLGETIVIICGCFIALKTLNVTSSSWALSLSSPFCTSIRALAVAKNGLSRMIGTSLSFSMSRNLLER